MRKPKCSVSIHGESWKVYLLHDDEFNDMCGKNNLALTMYNSKDKMFFFRHSHIDKSTVIHEVMHAFWSYQYLGSAKIAPHQFEEISCDLVANNLENIRKVSNIVFRSLKP